MNRGMKKWMPFKSLKGQYQVVNRMKEEKKKQTKPELSEDEAENINRILLSLRRGEKTCVTFYHERELMTRDGIFNRISQEERRIYFFGFSLSLGDLVHISSSTSEQS